MRSFDKITPLVMEEMQKREKSKMADGGHICGRTETEFGRVKLV